MANDSHHSSNHSQHEQPKRISRRRFVATAAISTGASLIGGCRPRAGSPRSFARRRVVLLGFDGLDPHLTRVWNDRGHLPHLARLARLGSLVTLQSSIPPQSPVAWASFITGNDPSVHGIFDFIHRSPDNRRPFFSTSSTHPAQHMLPLGKWRFPLGHSKVELLRRGRAFWNILADHSIPATILRIPSNFPPEPSSARTLSGLGTPDIQGSYGHFSYYSTQSVQINSDIASGSAYQVRVVNNVARAQLEGPPNSFRVDGKKACLDFTVYVDPENRAARVDIQNQKVILNQGEWSPWVRLAFHLAPLVGSCYGICRFYLKSVDPLQLYVSPVNIDPANPSMPISTPDDYGRELSERVGPFYTQGMAEDTKALSSGVLEDEEFLSQATLVFNEQLATLQYELQRLEEGVLFSYFSNSDLVTHMFWRTLDPRHPLWSPRLSERLGNTIREIYQRMDQVAATVIRTLGNNDLIMAFSDHGFSPYRRSFDLNCWLAENGYLSVDPYADKPALERTDWTRTRAYGTGFNALYINQLEREGEGVVAPGPDKESLLQELTAKLLQVRDPKTGARVVHQVRRTDRCYSRAPDQGVAPDLVIGYSRGYRGSWETALGDMADNWIADNTGKWSGDHCMDRDVVPGVLICNRPVRAHAPALHDLAATVLAQFGISDLGDMHGKPVL